MPEDMPNHKDVDLVNDTSVKYLDRAIADHHGNIKILEQLTGNKKGVILVRAWFSYRL